MAVPRNFPLSLDFASINDCDQSAHFMSCLAMELHCAARTLNFVIEKRHKNTVLQLLTIITTKNCTLLSLPSTFLLLCLLESYPLKYLDRLETMGTAF